MYKNYFGFGESPFQLVPNPAYLFLSKSHEEALAHLAYAVVQGDGFVEITGEVGTGKTTLCRAFIERLDPNIEVAYIFNPMLNAEELLAAIHDEFGIRYNPKDSVKTLIDSLNTFLIEKKAAGKRVLLVIDEAQNLSRDVLEQIRLLSNLETTTDKLLQIVLVGQPELRKMLDSYELRQLSQRITLRAALKPLSYADTVQYVQHRLQVAGPEISIPFTSAAFRGIYRYSKGIPRLINIVCNRALLVAYVKNRKKVTGRIIGAAFRELSGQRPLGFFSHIRVPVPVLILIGAAFLAGILFEVGGYSFARLKFFETPAASPIEPKAEENPQPLKKADTPAAAAEPTPSASLPLPAVTRNEAMIQALSLWGVSPDISPEIDAARNDPDFFTLAAEKNGFEMIQLLGDFNLLRTLNLPAILTFFEPNAGAMRYLTLAQRQGDTLTFLGSDPEAVHIDSREVLPRWSGMAFIPWKNFLDCRGTIPVGASESAILTVKELLKNIGYAGITDGAVYDEGTRGAVRALQAKYGMKEDGLVGSMTKILLYNEQGTFNIPFLIKEIP